jgi:SNF2 family DNA or RNA helicase
MAQVIVDKVGNRIHVRSAFADKDAVKAIIGSRWSPSKKVWTLPLDMETCHRLRDTFGDRLDIRPDLWDWAQNQRKREDQLKPLVDISKVDMTVVVDLPLVRTTAPTMWEAMMNRPYQPVAAKYMVEARRCLNADQPGIGKTIETLAALVEGQVDGPVLVLAPRNSCLTVWPQEIAKWLADDVPYTVTSLAGLTPKKRDAAWQEFTDRVNNSDGIHFLIANAEQVGIKKFTECPSGICDGDEDWCPDMALHVNKSEKRRPMLHSVTWSCIIADETHKWLINTRGKQASQVGYGFTKLVVAEDGPMYALSGTPLKGKKWNLFGTLNWLWPKTYTGKWRFIQSYWEVLTETQWAGKARGNIEVKTITGKWKDDKAEASFFRMLTGVMIRRTKDELRAINPAWMPPEKRYHDVWVDMEGTQRSHYNQMEKAAAAELKGGRLTATGVLAELTRLKQFAASDWSVGEGKHGVGLLSVMPSGKFKWLLEFLSERGIDQDGELSDDVCKVVVASQFTSLINVWARELQDKGIRCFTLTGETPDKARAAMVEDFQSNPDVRVFLINTNAGGVSITLDAADDIVLMDETWTPDDMEQVEDRVHRASNVEHQVDCWYVRTRGTVEEAIAKVNVNKAESNHVALDAQRGLKFASERFGAVIKEEK